MSPIVLSSLWKKRMLDNQHKEYSEDTYEMKGRLAGRIMAHSLVFFFSFLFF